MTADRLQMMSVTRKKGKKRSVRSERNASMASPMELWINVSQQSPGGVSAFILHYANLPSGKEIQSPQGKEAAVCAKLPSYVDLKDKIDASVPQAQQSVHEHGAQNSDLDESR